MLFRINNYQSLANFYHVRCDVSIVSRDINLNDKKSIPLSRAMTATCATNEPCKVSKHSEHIDVFYQWRSMLACFSIPLACTISINQIICSKRKAESNSKLVLQDQCEETWTDSSTFKRRIALYIL